MKRILLTLLTVLLASMMVVTTVGAAPADPAPALPAPSYGGGNGNSCDSNGQAALDPACTTTDPPADDSDTPETFGQLQQLGTATVTEVDGTYQFTEFPGIKVPGNGTKLPAGLLNNGKIVIATPPPTEGEAPDEPMTVEAPILMTGTGMLNGEEVTWVQVSEEGLNAARAQINAPEGGGPGHVAWQVYRLHNNGRLTKHFGDVSASCIAAGRKWTRLMNQERLRYVLIAVPTEEVPPPPVDTELEPAT